MFSHDPHRLIGVVAATLAILGSDRMLHADVLTRYPNGTRDAWFADAGGIGSIETITFTEHPLGLLTTQYQGSHGLEFSGAFVPYIHSSTLAFPNDGFGMYASTQGAVSVWIHFDRPMLAIAADFPGTFSVEFFDDHGLIGSSGFWGPGGPGNFTGFISPTPFSSVRLFDQDGSFGIDDLHFVAQNIPSSGAVAVLMAGAFAGRRRRRASVPVRIT